MGRVRGVIGDRSVVIGPTDQWGNTIINSSTAVGFDAYAAPGCIAIGAHARAGAGDPAVLVRELLARCAAAGVASDRLAAVLDLQRELESHRRPSVIKRLWRGVESLSTIEGVTALVARIGSALRPFIESA